MSLAENLTDDDLDAIADALQDHGEFYTRRQIIAAAAATGSLGGMLGLLGVDDASAQSSQVGTIGSDSSRVDLFAEDVDVSNALDASTVNAGDLSDEALGGSETGANPPVVIKSDDVTGAAVVSYANDDTGDNAARKSKWWAYNADGTQRVSEITIGEITPDGGEFSIYLTPGPISEGLAPKKVFDISANGDGTFNAQYPNTEVFHSNLNAEFLNVGGGLNVSPHASGTTTLSAGEEAALNASPDYESDFYQVFLNGDPTTEGAVETRLSNIGSQPQFNAVETTGTASATFSWAIIKIANS